MTLDDKIGHATALIRHFPAPQVLLCSFGKDSMVLLHLIRNTITGDELRTHQYPIPVIYYRHPWFPFKNEFAESVIRSWALEVRNFPPLACGIKYKPERLELVARYPFATSGMDIPLNTEEPHRKRDFVCGLEYLKQPKCTISDWPWVTAFHGHKDSDVDLYEGAVPLAHDAADAGGVNLVFPLRRWTNEDIWSYIEEHHVPFDKRRYAARLEVPDTWNNPDYLHACCACIDPRNDDLEVQCPKLHKMVPNVSRQVLRLDQIPSYIKREEQTVV